MKADCRSYFEKVSEYLDCELDWETYRKIETHLKDCPECQHCLDALRKTIRLGREAGRESMPPGVRERLRNALKQCLEQIEPS